MPLKKPTLQQTRELNAVKREEKINILSVYLDQSDEILEYMDTLPDDVYTDRVLMINELARIDESIDSFNVDIYPTLLGGILGVSILGTQHVNDDIVRAGRDAIMISPQKLDDIVSKIETQYLKDLQLLKDLGIYEARNYSKIIERTVTAGGDRYNRMMEKATRIQDPAQRTRVMQAVVNYADSTDPRGAAIRQYARLYDVKPTVDFRLSRSIWDTSKRDEIYKTVINGVNSGQSKKEINDNLQRYLKESGDGAYYRAERVIDTELQRAYNYAELETTRSYNVEFPDDRLLIVQSLSPLHVVPDICDDLEGIYDPVEGKVPEIPRHPNCICLETTVFASDLKKEKVRTEEGDIFKSTKFDKQTVNLL
jgi:hypothetical protein